MKALKPFVTNANNSNSRHMKNKKYNDTNE